MVNTLSGPNPISSPFRFFFAVLNPADQYCAANAPDDAPDADANKERDSHTEVHGPQDGIGESRDDIWRQDYLEPGPRRYIPVPETV